MPISVFDFIEMGDFIDAFAVSNGETIFGADVHKLQLCRRGMRKCELCDHFDIVTISCDSSNRFNIDEKFMDTIGHSDSWATQLESVIEQQVSNACKDLINFIKSNHDGCSIILVTLVATKTDENGIEKVFAEVLIPKSSKLRSKMSQKPFTGSLNDLVLIESMKRVFGSFEGTLINKLENLWDELEILHS